MKVCQGRVQTWPEESTEGAAPENAEGRGKRTPQGEQAKRWEETGFSDNKGRVIFEERGSVK